ncbi:MGMT family protein [Patescibacteria group bacterium]|nr:MGMT family protein [Patescibacteria group bacterium]
MKTFQEIYKIVSKIPRGKVASYKQVADAVKTTPRVVGFALHANKNPSYVPCHRVIKSDGTLAKGYAFGGKKNQMKKLKSEGINFDKSDRMNLSQCLPNFINQDEKKRKKTKAKTRLAYTSYPYCNSSAN